MQTAMSIAMQEMGDLIELANLKQPIIDGILAQLADNAISPDQFKGNALQKVQQALDYALTNKVAIKLAKMYDITGLGSIKLNKTNSLDRTHIYVLGQGGGIKKTDAGVIWTSDTADVGDMTFSNVKYESVAGAGTIVYDCNKLIRLDSINCAYRNVDQFLYVNDTRMYIQSIRSIGDTIVGGNGFAFDFVGAYDFSFTNSLIEARQDGIRQRYTVTPGSRYLYNVRIRDSVIEGLSGTAVMLANTESLVIDGCYFEKNISGDVVFNASSIIYNVNISNCRKYANGVGTNALIKWGAQPKNCTTNNNLAYDTAVHDTTSVQTGHSIFSNNDFSLTGVANIVGSFNPINILTSNQSIAFITQTNGDKATYLGPMKRLYKESTSVVLTAGQKLQVQVQFSETIPIDSLISAQVYVASNLFVNVCYAQRDATDKTKVNVYVQNLETGSATVQFIAVTVLKPFVSTTG